MAAAHGTVPRIKWTAERKRELERLTVERRLSMTKAAAAMGLTPQQVKGARQHFGLHVGGMRGVRKEWSDAALRELSEEVGGRGSREVWAQIARRLGKNPDAVRIAVLRWRKDNGVEVPREPKRGEATMRRLSREAGKWCPAEKWERMAKREGISAVYLRNLVGEWRSKQREGVS